MKSHKEIVTTGFPFNAIPISFKGFPDWFSSVKERNELLRKIRFHPPVKGKVV